MNGAILSTDTSVSVTVPTIQPGFGIVNPSGVGVYKLVIENEIAHFTSGVVTAGIQTWTLARGQEGTTAAGHATGITVAIEETKGAFDSNVQLSPTAQQTGTVNVSGAITSGGLLTGTGLSASHASSHDPGGSDVLKDLTRLAAGPAINGYIATSISDIALTGANTAPAAGVVILTKILTAQAYTINAIDLWVKQAGTGVTALANCFVGIYDSGGSRRYASADQSSAWATSGLKSLSLGGSAYTVTANDFIYIALLVGTQATTVVQISTGGSVATNIGLGVSASRGATQLTGQTSLPGSLTLSSNTASTVVYAIGVK